MSCVIFRSPRAFFPDTVMLKRLIVHSLTLSFLAFVKSRNSSTLWWRTRCHHQRHGNPPNLFAQVVIVACNKNSSFYGSRQTAITLLLCKVFVLISALNAK